MNVFRSRYIGDILLLLGRDLDVCVARSPKTEVGERLHDMPENALIKKVSDNIRTAHELCATAGLKDAEEQIGYSLMHLRWQTNKPDYSSMCAELRHTINALLQDLNNRVFIEVGSELRNCIDNDLLLGKAVNDAFPDAVADIREAGNCLAVDCNTAVISLF